MTLQYRKSSSMLVASGTFHSFVLCTALFLTATISSVYYSLLFFFMLLIYVYAFRARLNRAAARVLRPIVGMVMLGIIFSYNNEIYDVFKDIWYGSKAIVCFLLGYHIAKKITDTNQFFNYFVQITFLLAIIYLLKIFTGTNEINVESVTGIGGLSIVSAMVIPLLLFRKVGFSFKGAIFLKILIVTIVLASFALSFSRTAIGCLFLLTLAGAGFFENIKRSFLYLGLPFVALMLITNRLQIPISQESMFLWKIANSLSEISFTDGSDPQSMIWNWRGFEAYRAYSVFNESSIYQKIFGRGWGATVDLGLGVQMTEDLYFRHLPLLHNGYLHILTKYGLLGLLLYFIFLWRVIIESRKYFIKNNNGAYANFLIGLGFILVYTSMTITGILNKNALDSVLIVMGLFFGSADMPFKKSSLVRITPLVISSKIR